MKMFKSYYHKKHFKNIWRRTSIYNKLISFFLKQATPKKQKNKKNQHLLDNRANKDEAIEVFGQCRLAGKYGIVFKISIIRCA